MPKKKNPEWKETIDLGTLEEKIKSSFNETELEMCGLKSEILAIQSMYLTINNFEIGAQKRVVSYLAEFIERKEKFDKWTDKYEKVKDILEL